MSVLDAPRTLVTGLTRAFELSKLKPRPHQIRTVAKVLMDIASHEHTKSEIRNYLIQHTAGSGKSLTIAALVLCLLKLKIWQNGMDRRGFDMILVLNDRIVLDDQLSNAIIEFLSASHVHDVVQTDSINDLKARLIGRTKGVIITTFQKFMQLRGENLFQKKRIAIIEYEAHRTHGSKATEELHFMLSHSAQQSELITYFSFTCSPTQRTLEQFGIVRSDENRQKAKKAPFFAYSVEESVRDGFTLNVLQDYMYVHPSVLRKTHTDTGVLEEEEVTVRDKAEYIVNHFVGKSKELSKGDFVPKAMLVVKGREKILQYKKEIEDCVAKLPRSKKFDILCTFTPFGPNGAQYKETDIKVNGRYADQNLTEVFKDSSSPVKLIIVAEKLQTGFDAPTLAIMYVDKLMRDTALVQTLGRLSRIAKDKEHVCVVNFCNTETEAREAFKEFTFPPENTTALDEAIEKAHVNNRILDNLIMDLHGMHFTENQLDFARQIWAKKAPKKMDEALSPKSIEEEATSPPSSQSTRSPVRRFKPTAKRPPSAPLSPKEPPTHNGFAAPLLTYTSSNFEAGSSTPQQQRVPRSASEVEVVEGALADNLAVLAPEAAGPIVTEADLESSEAQSNGERTSRKRRPSEAGLESAGSDNKRKRTHLHPEK